MSCVSDGERTTGVVDNKKRDERDDDEKEGEKSHGRRRARLKDAMATTWEMTGMAMARSRRVEARVRRRVRQRPRSKRERRRPCAKDRRARSARRRATERGRGRDGDGGDCDGGFENGVVTVEVVVDVVVRGKRISVLVVVVVGMGVVLRRYSRKNAHSSKVTPANRVASVPDTLRKSALKGPRPPAGCFARVRRRGGGAGAVGGCEVASGREDGLFGCEDDDELVVERMHTSAVWRLTLT